MGPGGVFPAEMPERGRSLVDPLDDDTAERLVAGRVSPDDAPPGYAGVAGVLQAAAGPAAPEELAGQPAALAMFRAYGPRPAARRPQGRARGRPDARGRRRPQDRPQDRARGRLDGRRRGRPDGRGGGGWSRWRWRVWSWPGGCGQPPAPLPRLGYPPVQGLHNPAGRAPARPGARPGW